MSKSVKRAEISVEGLKIAGIRKNSLRAATGAVRHYEETFRGSLPASITAINEYIVFCLETGLAVTTVSQRVSLLGMWHREFGFADPSADKDVKAVLKGARTQFGTQPRKAEPLTRLQIERAVQTCDNEITAAATADSAKLSRAMALKAIRDKVFILVGFWFAFRSDELVSLRFENVTFGFSENGHDNVDGRTMRIYLSSSKSDKNSDGREWTIKEMPTLCPVNAMLDWQAARLAENGPIFVKIDRWGHPSTEPLHINSVMKMMRSRLLRAGIDAEKFSTHSLRRGFANYAISHKTDARELMSWVKWKDIRSAIRYIEDTGSLANDLAEKDNTIRLEKSKINRLK